MANAYLMNINMTSIFTIEYILLYIYIYNIDYNTVYTNTHYKYQLNIYYKFNLYLNS